MRHWAAVALVVALATGVVRADDTPPDADRDGVTDAADACPDSGQYELVDAAGCSVCDCDQDASGEDWASRSAYVRCVLDEVHARRADGRLGRKGVRLVLKAMRSSTCGYATKVRCCLMFSGKPKGMCRLMDEVACDSELLGGVDVEDLDSGSCYPNPCVAE